MLGRPPYLLPSMARAVVRAVTRSPGLSSPLSYVPVSLGMPIYFSSRVGVTANGSGQLVSWTDLTGTATLTVTPGAGITVGTDGAGIQFVRFVDRGDTATLTLAEAQEINSGLAYTMSQVVSEYDNDAIAGWSGIEDAAGTYGVGLAFGGDAGDLRGYNDTATHGIAGGATQNQTVHHRVGVCNGAAFQSRNHVGSSATTALPAQKGVCDRLQFGKYTPVIGGSGFANYNVYGFGLKQADMRGADLAALDSWVQSHFLAAGLNSTAA